MFNPEEDKKIIKESIEEAFHDRRMKWIQRIFLLLRATKIISMWALSLVGFCYLFFYFLMGQPYVCTYGYQSFEPDCEFENTLIEICDADLGSYRNYTIELEDDVKSITESFDSCAEQYQVMHDEIQTCRGEQ